MQISNVEITKLETNNNELSDVFFQNCKFCNKIVRVDYANFRSCLNLSTHNFYCAFCLRYGLNQNPYNILSMSYRGIFAYYYYKFYMDRNSRWLMYVNDIKAMIDNHVKIGLLNPVFVYDEEDYIWHINFNRIGAKMAPFQEVLDIMSTMYDCFYLQTYLGVYARDSVWSKFSKAVEIFQTKRKRPKSKSLLIPTIYGSLPTSLEESEDFYEMTRNFTSSRMIIK